jgi:3-(3-hydroxy-phenyl)propionate hydroxylase
MTPKSRASQVLRDAVLSLAAEHGFARALVNSGRLSVPTALSASPLNTPDADAFEGWMLPGAPADDAPLRNGRWLLETLPPGFVLLVFIDLHDDSVDLTALALAMVPLPQGPLAVYPYLVPCEGLLVQRYDARPGTVYLLRPDQHVAARWRSLDLAAVRSAVARASAQGAPA